LSECDVSNQQFEELIREKYKLNQEQYNQIMQDAKESYI
jgi:hypothetical protein